LSRQKILTAFVDGDRGGDLNIQELLQVAELDFATKAPDGKEVEELTKKEIHKALRSRITGEQAKTEFTGKKPLPRPHATHHPRSYQRPQRPAPRPQYSSAPRPVRKAALTAAEKKSFKQMLEDLIGTRGAYILDPKLNILGKVPITELAPTVKSLNSGIYAIILDGSVDKDLVDICERSNVKFLVGMDSKVMNSVSVNIVTAEKLD